MAKGASIKCPKCGHPIEKDHKHCSECGASLKNMKTSRLKSAITSAQKILKGSGLGPGSVIGKKYEILEVIGSGGMGTVYKAIDKKLNRTVAIKTLGESFSRDKDLRSRFLREARSLSQIEHQNICTIYEILEEKGRDFIIMQFVSGKGLDELPVKALSWSQRAEIFYQVCQGLARAHSSGIVHRDIKPSNIRLGDDGVVKILDFGLAKKVGVADRSANDPSDATVPLEAMTDPEAMNLTREGVVLGTVFYMSPEQATGAEVDRRSDIFSLGVVMYELSAGRLPFPEGDTISALYHIINTPPFKINRFAPGIPKRLARVILKALEKEPEKRQVDIGKIIKELEKVKVELGATSSSRVAEELSKALTLKRPETIKTTGLGVHTSRIRTTVTRVGKRFRRSWVVFLIFILVGAVLYNVLKEKTPEELISGILGGKTGEPAIIVISEFDSGRLSPQVGKSVERMLVRSLSQLGGVWFIDSTILKELQDKLGITEDLTDSNLRILNKHEKVLAVVQGTIERFGQRGMIEIHPSILKISEDDEGKAVEKIRLDITPGESVRSILENQVDEIAMEIIEKLNLGEDRDVIQPISGFMTSDWNAALKFLKGEENWSKRNTEEARRDLIAALQVDKEFAMARGRLGEIEKFYGRKEQAFDHILKAIAKPERLVYSDRLYFESLAAELRLDYKKQIDLLVKLKEFRPLDWNTSFALAESYFHRGKINLARQTYEETLRLSPNFTQALNHLGYCLSYLGDHQKAIEILKQYKNLDDSYNSYDSLGDGYTYSGDYEKAVLYKKASLQKNPNTDWVYRSLSDIYLVCGMINESLEMNEKFRLAAKTDKRTLAEAATQKGYILLLSGKVREAGDEIRKALKLYDNQEINLFVDELHWLAGLWHLQVGHTAEARREMEWMKVIVDRYSINSEKYFTFYKYYLHLKAMVEYAEGKTALAKQTMDALVSLGPKLGYWISFHNRAYFLTELGRLYYEMNNLEQAGQYLKQALNYTPTYPFALYYSAKVAVKERDTKRAEAMYSRFLDICKLATPDYSPIQEARAFFKKAGISK